MQNDQLDGLIALKVVAEKRNFTLAAETLGVTPSAVSQTIKHLEERVGITLLSRTTRSISVTEAGERFLSQAGPALDQILNAFEDIGSFAQKPSGLLRINLPRITYHSFMVSLIKSFTQEYPDITVELFFEDAKSDVVGSGFDAGIRVSDILAKDMVAIKLFGPIKFVTAASPEYLNKMGRPKHPKDLLSHCCILFRLGTGLYDRWEFEYKGEEFQVQVKGPLIMNDAIATAEAGITGQGIFYTTEDGIEEHVKAGRLEIVLEKYASTSAGYYLYFPKRSQVLPKLRAFIDHVKKQKSSRLLSTAK